MRRPAAALALLAALSVALAPPAAAQWRVDPERSTFAVLTHRAGLGARLAHDHLILARGARAELGFDPAAPEATTFEFSIPVLALDVDPPAERAALAERLNVFGALSDPLPPVEEGDREKVRAAMLGPGQLYAERFPEVRAELVSLERRGGGGNARVALGWNARVRITVRGRTVEKVFPARWELADGVLIAEVLGEAKFTDFQIRPYSAVLGAVKNEDLFQLYVNLVATEVGGTD